ncbi:hypothetical protein HDU80_001966, partial [Chytriomyces hyalinus]
SAELIKWKDEMPTISALSQTQMSSANDGDAILKLQKIQSSNFERAVSKSGQEWMIPIADNTYGFQSELAKNYIRKSREIWSDAMKTNPFQQTLCSCHTVYIKFRKEALNQDSFNSAMLAYLKEALEPMFIMPPTMLTKDYKWVVEFLKDFTRVAGPVYIVLDEIENAFEKEDLKRPVNISLRASKFKFECLNLHLLRPESIASILNKTRIMVDGKETIATKLGLTQQDLESLAKYLFQETNGNPRSLLEVLEKCHTLEEIRQYSVPLEFSDLRLFQEKLLYNKNEVHQLLVKAESGDAVDLTAVVLDAGQRPMPLVNIVSNSLMAWEGRIAKAHVRISPKLKQFIEGQILPFKDYLKHVGSVSRVSIDYATVFEWMFLKRFQELFLLSKEPGHALPAFFRTPKFGQYKSVQFGDMVRSIPKITDKGSKSPELDSNCILIGRAVAEVDAAVILTVGLAVKNYASTPFMWKDLWDRLFWTAKCIVICCTKYSDAIMSKFDGRAFFVHKEASCHNIDEVVVLNLSTPKHRAAFFDIHGNLSRIVENIVEKAEVEYQDIH